VVDNAEGLAMVAVLGPLNSVQLVEVMVAPPVPEAVPFRVAGAGMVIVCAEPALTVGGVGAGEPPFTIDVSPCLIIHWKTLEGA